jgi:hypothetical protein
MKRLPWITTIALTAATCFSQVAPSDVWVGPRAREMMPASFFPQIDESRMTPKVGVKLEFTPIIEVLAGANAQPDSVPIALMPEADIKPRLSVPGIGYTLAKPPDPEIAVGNRWLLQVVNTKVAFFNKSTLVKTFERSLNDFFRLPTSNTRRMSDPRVAFDKATNRWFVAAITVDFSTKESYIRLAVSKDGDPNVGWYLYDFNVKFTQDGNVWWLDFPTMGFNKDAVVMSGNAFTFSGTQLLGSRILTFRKSALLTGSGPSVAAFTEKSAYSIQWIRSSDPSLSQVYGVCPRFTTAIQVYALTNLATTPVFHKLLEPPAKNAQTIPVASMDVADPAVGPANRRVDSLDARFMSAFWRAGSIWTAHGVRIGPTDKKSQIRWYEVKPQGWPLTGKVPIMGQKGTISGASGQWLFCPALAQNRDGDVAFAYTRMSSTIVGQLVTSVRKVSDPAGKVTAPSMQFSSTGAFYGNSTSASAPNRWGDYFGVDVDPVDGTTFWMTGMVGDQGSGNPDAWKTHIFSLNVRPPLLQTVPLSSISKVFGGLVTGTLPLATTSNNAYYKVRSSGTPAKAVIATVFRVTGERSRVGGLELVLEAAAVTGADLQVQILNRAKNRLDQVSGVALANGDLTFRFPLITFYEDYFDAAGNIQFNLSATGPNSAPFEFKIDLAQLRVTRV